MVVTRSGEMSGCQNGQEDCKSRLQPVQSYTAVIERCPETGLFVGYVPGFPGAHSQGETLEELNDNLTEVITMILDDGTPEMAGEFVGTQIVLVA